jgi:hypothetical protein
MNNTVNNIQKNILEPASKSFTKHIAPIVTNPYMKLIIMYITIASIILSIHTIPNKFKQLLGQPLMKLLITFLGVYAYTENLNISLIFTLIVVVSYFIAKFFSKEMFELISPTSDSYPGCTNVTVADLLLLYNNDRNELKKAMYTYGVPLNIVLNDESAPLIASYIISHKDVTSSCSNPK